MDSIGCNQSGSFIHAFGGIKCALEQHRPRIKQCSVDVPGALTRAIIGKIPARLHWSVDRCGRRRSVHSVLFSVVAAVACGTFFGTPAAAQTSMSCEAGRVSTIWTFAGTDEHGYGGDGGPATEAQLNFPSGVAVDAVGHVYVADNGNHRIRRIAPDGTIDTIAGTGQQGFSGDGGAGSDARLFLPDGVAVDAAGYVYVADLGNHRIRRIALDGTIETIAGTARDSLSGAFSGDGGPATEAELVGQHGDGKRPRQCRRRSLCDLRAAFRGRSDAGGRDRASVPSAAVPGLREVARQRLIAPSEQSAARSLPASSGDGIAGTSRSGPFG